MAGFLENGWIWDLPEPKPITTVVIRQSSLQHYHAMGVRDVAHITTSLPMTSS